MQTDARKLAQRIAENLEDVGRGVVNEKEIAGFCEKISDAKVRAVSKRILGDVFRTVHGREIGAGSLRAFVSSWLTGIRGEIAPQSFIRYNQVANDFLKFAGAIEERDITAFGARDDVLILGYRDELAKRVSPGTANTALKIVRQIFKSAAQRFKIESPAALVGGLKNRRTDADRRRAFTLPEVGRILREVRGSEWEGLVLMALYTGQRLSDIAALRWENIDLDRGELALTTRKTGRRILLPLAEPFAEYLSRLPSSDSPLAFVFPKASGFVARTKAEQTLTLSNQFYDILARVGLVRRRRHLKAEDGMGRNARRQSSELSFHSFRHTATSLLKNAGVPQSVVMDIIGHESKAISQIYTHVGDAEKRLAMAALPSLASLLRHGRQPRSLAPPRVPQKSKRRSRKRE